MFLASVIEIKSSFEQWVMDYPIVS
jgi:hypothetical protein